MGDIILHLIIPAIALFAFYDRAYLKWIMALSPLAWLPDLDHLPWFYAYERAMLHNVFIVLPFVLIALYGWKRGNKTMANAGTIAAFYIASHIMLDLDGVKMLWPLSDYIFALNINIPFGMPGQEAVMSSSVYILLVFVLGFLISIPNVRKTFFGSKIKTKELPD